MRPEEEEGLWMGPISFICAGHTYLPSFFVSWLPPLVPAWPWCSDPPALPWELEPITPPRPFDPSAPPWLHAPLGCQTRSSLRLGLGQSSFCLPHWLPGLWLHLIPLLYSFPRAPHLTVLSLAPPKSAEPLPPPWSRELATPLRPSRPAVWPWVFVSLAPAGYPSFLAPPWSVNHLLQPGLTTKAHPSDGSAWTTSTNFGSSAGVLDLLLPPIAIAPSHLLGVLSVLCLYVSLISLCT